MNVSNPGRDAQQGSLEKRHDREWLTVREVATRLDVTSDTVRRWIRGGRLAATSLGGRAGYRVRVGDLERFLRQSAVR